MITIVPEEYYYELYINICLVLVFITLFHTRVLKLSDQRNLFFVNISGYLLFTFLIFYIGLRPISSLFGDTSNYYRAYLNYQYGGTIGQVEDYGWHVFMKFMSGFVNVYFFFTIVCFIYIFPMYRLSKKLFKEYWYYAFIMFVVSFSFWTYSVNGIRNGAACSLFLLGLSYHDKKWFMGLFFLIATLFHRTLYLPILAFILTFWYNNPKFYFYGWLASIPLSLLFGGIWISLFASLGFADDRIAGYLLGDLEGTSATTGFRWDFLFHSAFAVFAGWYFVFKRKYRDKIYFQLLNTYLICNAFWILVIRANYSNRFAYLSWFMMAVVIIYPLLKKDFFKNQHAIIGNLVAFYFAFTYLMYYVYYN